MTKNSLGKWVPAGILLMLGVTGCFGQPSPAPERARFPGYPELAINARQEAELIVELRIAADGSVVSAEVVEGSHPLFDRHLLEATKEWKFHPAAAAWSTAVSFVFRLEPSSEKRQAVIFHSPATVEIVAGVRLLNGPPTERDRSARRPGSGSRLE